VLRKRATENPQADNPWNLIRIIPAKGNDAVYKKMSCAQIAVSLCRETVFCFAVFKKT
jgi:hypothetical protein